MIGVRVDSVDWKLRLRLFVQRFWQPTSACLTTMPGNVANVWSLAHWGIALQTGLGTGILVLLLSFTPLARWFRNRYGNASIVGGLTMLADAYAHPSHFIVPYGEAVVTGIVSGLLALAGSFVFEDRARRVRMLWSRLGGRPG